MGYSAMNDLSVVIRMSLLASCCREGTLHRGYLFPVFRETKEGQSVHGWDAFQINLIRNNQYATLAYFGADCLP